MSYETTFVENSTKKRKLLIWLIVVLVAVAVGLTALFLYQKNSGWSTYNNSKYGYSLRYPSKWAIDSTNAEKDFINGVGGESIISNYKNPLAQLESENPPADLVAVKIAVYKVDASTTLSKFIRSKVISLLRDDADFVKHKTSLAGLEGEQLVYIQSGEKGGIFSVKTVVKKDTNMFVLSLSSFKQDASKEDKYNLPDALAAIHSTVLNSFQLK